MRGFAFRTANANLIWNFGKKLFTNNKDFVVIFTNNKDFVVIVLNC